LVTQLTLQLDMSQLQSGGRVRPHATADVVIVMMGSIAQAAAAPGAGQQFSLVGGIALQAPPGAGGGLVGLPRAQMRPYADALISNEVFVFGYPISVGHPGQIDHTRPLLRRGVIAGKTDANQTIVLDCPLYQGNSGGLAIEVVDMGLQRQSFGLGVATQMVPFYEQFESKQYKTINTSVENSGYSIVTPMDRVIELL
jgi:hypothetical protein